MFYFVLQVFLLTCLALYKAESSTMVSCSSDTSEYMGSPIYGNLQKKLHHHLAGYYSLVSPSLVGKRQPHSTEPFFPENPLPWSCTFETRWRDLGDDHYPRFVRDVTCSQIRCWYGHYACAAQSTNLKILRRNNGQCVDTTLPSALRTEWKFVNVRVTVGCICSR